MVIGGGKPMLANRQLAAKGVVQTVSCTRLMMSAIEGTIAEAKVCKLALVDPLQS